MVRCDAEPDFPASAEPRTTAALLSMTSMVSLRAALPFIVIPGEHRPSAMRGKGIHLEKVARNRRRIDSLPVVTQSAHDAWNDKQAIAVNCALPRDRVTRVIFRPIRLRLEVGMIAARPVKAAAQLLAGFRDKRRIGFEVHLDPLHQHLNSADDF